MKIYEKKKCISLVFITIITIKYEILKIVYLYKLKLSSKFWTVQTAQHTVAGGIPLSGHFTAGVFLAGVCVELEDHISKPEAWRMEPCKSSQEKQL